LNDESLGATFMRTSKPSLGQDSGDLMPVNGHVSLLPKAPDLPFGRGAGDLAGGQFGANLMVIFSSFSGSPSGQEFAGDMSLWNDLC
jgi:hypothetical protein